MYKQVSATDAKNNFGGLLEDVATLGRVDVMKHGKLVAVVLSPQTLDVLTATVKAAGQDQWGKTHMIPAESARGARMLNRASSFEEE